MASIWYQRIVPLQEPFDLGLDAAGRAQVVFNLMATKTQSDTFLEELTKILVTAGMVVNTIFQGAQALIPDGDGPYLSIVETGGPAALLIHNEPGLPKYPRPTAQVVGRALDYVGARTYARTAYNALMVVRNQFIVVP